MGLGSAPASKVVPAPVASNAKANAAYQKLFEASAAAISCSECGGKTTSGTWGVDSLWYCGPCWGKWQSLARSGARCGGAAGTDAGTECDTDADSGTEGTII